jgi:hypothetical protein
MTTYLIILASLISIATPSLAAEQASPPAATAEPFRLDQTQQIFTKTAHGGVQHIQVKSASNSTEINHIRTHLQRLTKAYQNGDFSIPEKVHGANMPGLVQLKMANPNDIRFEYREIDKGGQIHYSSEYPQYVQAIHEWFDAQTAAHEGRTSPEHNQHHADPTQ